MDLPKGILEEDGPGQVLKRLGCFWIGQPVSVVCDRVDLSLPHQPVNRSPRWERGCLMRLGKGGPEQAYAVGNDQRLVRIEPTCQSK